MASDYYLPYYLYFMNSTSLHRFHIPVMGLAFTIDTPVKVARFGISSVISIMEDRLIEMMRSHYYPIANKVFKPIETNESDYRAKRITDYLNLINEIVQSQVEKLRNSAFETGSEIVKYFEMLPENSRLKIIYRQFMNTIEVDEKNKLETWLREQVVPGTIDVNIMTKVDRNVLDAKGEILPDTSDAVAALRGYADSELTNSSVIFSAGMNPRLFSYLTHCPGFNINAKGEFSKKVIVKVSDYRSALIQGKFLAKKGIWVSEFRVESGLNCGGHAFATEGSLLGPVLEEFKCKRAQLINELFEIYQSVVDLNQNIKLSSPPAIHFSVQGGIGTCEEDNFLHRYYQLTSTGWGTPFLLVPEATTVDAPTLKLLSEAKEKDVSLSRNSPLGVRFYYLNNTTSHQEKLQRIKNGKPGSPCTEKHLVSNTEFTKEPICTASYKYQKLKIAQLETLDLPKPEHDRQLKNVLDKECLCIGLSNSAAINYGKTLVKKLEAVTICPGPNIVNFSKITTLATMVDHIYGRTNLLDNARRPHMFIAELNMYINYLSEQINEVENTETFEKRQKYFRIFYRNLQEGMNYYRGIAELNNVKNGAFVSDLDETDLKLKMLVGKFEYASTVG